MAAKGTISRARARYDRSDDTVERSPALAWSSLPLQLRELIDEERLRLMDAEAVLHCAVVALDGHDRSTEDIPDYQSVINTARTLIRQSIDRLDAVTIGTSLRDAEAAGMVEPISTRVRRYAVREQAVVYLN